MDERSDEQLVEDYRNGDEAALAELMRRYERELLAFLIRLMGNRAAAEDVFQDAFIQIHLSSDAFDVNRRFKPWLFTIAANKGRDYFRKNARHTSMVGLSTPIRGSAESGQTTRLVDLLELDTEEESAGLSQAELRDRVRHIIDELPRHMREILLLAYFQRMSYNQMADSLGIPLGTVKSRLHSAVATFGQRWRDLQHGDNGELNER